MQVSLAYRGLDGVVAVLGSKNAVVQEEAIRFVCNLVAPAGFITGCSAENADLVSIGRFGSVIQAAGEQSGGGWFGSLFGSGGSPAAAALARRDPAVRPAEARRPDRRRA